MTIFFPSDWTELQKCELAFRFEESFLFVAKCYDNRYAEIYVKSDRRYR